MRNIISESVAAISGVILSRRWSKKFISYLISQRYSQRQTRRRLFLNIPRVPDTISKLDRDNETGKRLKSLNRRTQAHVLTTSISGRNVAGNYSEESGPDRFAPVQQESRSSLLIGKTFLSRLYIELDAFVYCIKLLRSVRPGRARRRRISRRGTTRGFYFYDPSFLDFRHCYVHYRDFPLAVPSALARRHL